jgi:D-alanine-D-alanine ligase-like ATP-grasp enzyme
MNQKKILIILGGVSSEREISLRSGKACIRALKQLKY